MALADRVLVRVPDDVREEVELAVTEAVADTVRVSESVFVDVPVAVTDSVEVTERDDVLVDVGVRVAEDDRDAVVVLVHEAVTDCVEADECVRDALRVCDSVRVGVLDRVCVRVAELEPAPECSGG